MVDKFGTSRVRGTTLTKMLQNLDMGDHRITNLGRPEESRDAATRRWVNRQIKDSMGGSDAMQTKVNQMAMELKRVEREHAAAIKGLEKDMRGKVGKAECVSTNGGKMAVDLDMQNHAIRNLPEGVGADEPVTKGWYAKNWQDLKIDLQGKIDAVDQKIKAYQESARVAIEAIEEKVESHHGTGRSGRSVIPPTEDKIEVAGFSILG